MDVIRLIPNGFEKTTARGLFFFRSNYSTVILKYRTAIEYVHCYKLAVQKSFKTAGNPDNKQVLLSVETFYSLFITV